LSLELDNTTLTKEILTLKAQYEQQNHTRRLAKRAKKITKTETWLFL
jgi:hypothetical protein